MDRALDLRRPIVGKKKQCFRDKQRGTKQLKVDCACRLLYVTLNEGAGPPLPPRPGSVLSLCACYGTMTAIVDARDGRDGGAAVSLECRGMTQQLYTLEGVLPEKKGG